MVETIHQQESLLVHRTERATPYSTNYSVVAYQESKEEIEQNRCPEIRPLEGNPLDADEILLFFPIWWYTMPMPIRTFLESIPDWKGKTIVLFANSYTNDPQYMENAMKDAKASTPTAHLVEGLFNASPKEHIRFLESRWKNAAK